MGLSPMEHPWYPLQALFVQSQGFLQHCWALGAMCLAMLPHPLELGCASSMAKPADGAPARGNLRQRRLGSWASLGRQCWR